ncbi:MAG: molecular chaperone TorD family protein [Nitrososphaerales archaeon]
MGSFTDVARAANSDEPRIIAKKRAEIYQILATAFYPPVEEIAERLWTHAISQWKPEEVKTVVLNPVELRLEYNRLFVGPGALACPPYESVYRRDRPESERGMLMGPSVIDVKKRYSEAGLQISKSFSDLPDHVAVELEFMCYLCAKEADAVASGADEAIWRKREAEFWKFHLNMWIGEFSDRLLKNSKSPFYRALALFLKDWFEEEGDAFMETLGD